MFFRICIQVTSITLTQWLNTWGRLCYGSAGLSDFPCWVQMLPGIFFKCMDLDGEGTHGLQQNFSRGGQDFFLQGGGPQKRRGTIFEIWRIGRERVNKKKFFCGRHLKKKSFSKMRKVNNIAIFLLLSWNREGVATFLYFSLLGGSNFALGRGTVFWGVSLWASPPNPSPGPCVTVRGVPFVYWKKEVPCFKKNSQRTGSSAWTSTETSTATLSAFRRRTWRRSPGRATGP